jgi:hypothetical protein
MFQVFKLGGTAIVVGIIAIAGLGLHSQSTTTDENDEKAYYNTAIIKGGVTILNHPTLGTTPGSSTLCFSD